MTNTGAINNRYWCHERQILEIAGATSDKAGTGAMNDSHERQTAHWCHERQILELLPEPQMTKPILEPWTTKPILETGATSKRQPQEIVLEPSTTDTGAAAGATEVIIVVVVP